MKNFIIIVSCLFALNVSAQVRYVATTGSNAGTCNLPGSPCLTVQYAIGQAAAGDVIEIAAGTYAGFNITKSLTINGVKKLVNGYAAGRGIGESFISSEISIASGVNDVAIDGIAVTLITPQPTATDVAIRSVQNNNLVIKNTYIRCYDNIITYDAVVVSQANNFSFFNNHITYAQNGVMVSKSSNVSIQGNVIGEKDVTNLDFSINELGIDYSAVVIGDGCGNVKIENNRFWIIFDGAIKVQAGPVSASVNGLVDKISVRNNYLDNSYGGVRFTDGDNTLSLNGGLVSIIENYFYGGGNAVYLGNQATLPGTKVDLSANYWGPTAGKPGATTAFTGAANAEYTVWLIPAIITTPFNGNDSDVSKIGFQSERKISFTAAGNPETFTIQQAINATPVDPLNRWELQTGAFNVYNYTENITLNRPIIFNGRFFTFPSTTTINPNASLPQTILVTADSVVIRNFILPVNNLCANAISIEGVEQAEVQTVTFNTTTTNYNYLTLDSKKAAAPFVANNAIINNCTFNQGGSVSGTGILFKNTNKGVSGQPLPEFSGVTITNNKFSQNIQNFLRMDNTATKEFSTNLDVSNNQYNVSGTLKLPSVMSEAELFNLEDKIVHAIDLPNVAFLSVKADNYYATTNSFFAPTTTVADLQRAINVAPATKIVHIKTGVYTEPATVTKSLTFDLDDVSAPTINTLIMNTATTGDILSVFGNLRIGTALNLTKGYIDQTVGSTFTLAPTFTTYSGGNTDSYVRDALRIDNTGKTSPFDMTFQVGNGVGNYRPVTITGMTGTNPVMSLQTTTGGMAGATTSGGAFDIFLPNPVSATNRSWNLRRISGTTTNSGNIALSYNAGDGVDVTRQPYLAVGMATTLTGAYSGISAVSGGTGATTGTVTGTTNALPASAFLAIGIDCPAGLPAPTTNIATAAITLCLGKSTVLSVDTPNPLYTYIWNGPGHVNQVGTSITVLSSEVGGVGSTGNYQVYYVTDFTCQSSPKAVDITIINQPVATFSYIKSGFCNNEGMVSPTVTDAGGAFTATPAGLVIDATTGQINTNTSTLGDYQVTYTVGGGASGCNVAQSTLSIKVNQGATANIKIVSPTIFRDLSEVYYCSGSIVLKADKRSDYVYQWQKNGVDIPSETKDSIVVNATGVYRVGITNGCGVLYSNIISVFPSSAPTGNITSSAGTEIILGKEVVLTAVLQNPTGREKFTWKSPNPLSFEGKDTTKNSITFLMDFEGDFKVLVNNGAGCETTLVLPIKAIPLDLFVPTAFSPNGAGDTKNEKFRVYGNGIKEINLKIYDRVGKLVYETSNIDEIVDTGSGGNGWDGTSNGKLLPTGVYTWSILGKKRNDEPLSVGGRTYGTVLLMR